MHHCECGCAWEWDNLETFLNHYRREATEKAQASERGKVVGCKLATASGSSNLLASCVIPCKGAPTLSRIVEREPIYELSDLYRIKLKNQL